MSKSVNSTVYLDPQIAKEIPYRGFKRILVAWAKEQETFTRDEFFKAVLDLKAEHKVVSVMKDEVLVKAWWSELKNKAKIFIEVTPQA